MINIATRNSAIADKTRGSTYIYWQTSAHTDALCIAIRYVARQKSLGSKSCWYLYTRYKSYCTV